MGNVLDRLLSNGYSIKERHILETAMGGNIVLKEFIHTSLRTAAGMDKVAVEYINDMYVNASDAAYGMPYGFKQADNVYQVHYGYRGTPTSITDLGCGVNRVCELRWDHSVQDYTGNSVLVDMLMKTTEVDGEIVVQDYDLKYSQAPYGLCSTAIIGTIKKYNRDNSAKSITVLNDTISIDGNKVQCFYEGNTSTEKFYMEHKDKIFNAGTKINAPGFDLMHKYYYKTVRGGKKTVTVVNFDGDTEVLQKNGNTFKYSAYMKIHRIPFCAKLEWTGSDFGTLNYTLENDKHNAIFGIERSRRLHIRKEYQFISKGVVRYIVTQNDDRCCIEVIANFPVRHYMYTNAILGTNTHHYYEPCFF